MISLHNQFWAHIIASIVLGWSLLRRGLNSLPLALKTNSEVTVVTGMTKISLAILCKRILETITFPSCQNIKFFSPLQHFLINEIIKFHYSTPMFLWSTWTIVDKRIKRWHFPTQPTFHLCHIIWSTYRHMRTSFILHRKLIHISIFIKQIITKILNFFNL